MFHLKIIMESVARLLYKPHNAATAAMDHFDALRTHGDEALKDWDEVQVVYNDYLRLEAENEEMRRLLRAHGIIYKGQEDAA